jgi:hypothetical protein
LAGMMLAKLAETLGLTQTIRAIPITEPEAVQTIGLVAPAREPMTPVNSALVEIARKLAPTLEDFTSPRVQVTPVKNGKRRHA